jgi:hypothetical protein
LNDYEKRHLHASKQKQKNTEYSIAIDSVEEVASETPSRRKPSLFRTFAYTTLAFLLIFAINWTTDKSDSQLASWNPFLYSSPNEFLIKVLEVGEEVEVSEVLEEIEEVEIAEVSEEIEEVEATEEIEVVEATEEIEVTEVPEILNSYYIIGGSFQTEESAEKCVNILKKQGFENASSLEKNNKGNIRVYYESFAEKADALIRLEEIKRDYNASAWLLFQK